MSKTPVVGSVDAKVKVASHLSKVPLMATDAFTANLIELSSVVILKTGTCARRSDMNFLPSVSIKATKRILKSAQILTPDVCSEILLNLTGRIEESRRYSFGAAAEENIAIRLSPARPVHQSSF